MNNRNPQHEMAHMSWALPIFLFLAVPPVGVLLAVLKILDQQSENRENASRQNWANRMNGQPGTAQPYAPPQTYAAPWLYHPNNAPAPPRPTAQPGMGAPQPNVPFTAPSGVSQEVLTQQAQKKALHKRRVQMGALMVLGVLFLVMGLPQLLSGIDSLIWLGFDSYWLSSYILPALAKLLGGAGLLFLGSRSARSLRREKLLATIVGSRDHVAIHELSASSGYSEKKTMQLAKDAIANGLFGPAAYIDMRTQMLIVRGEPPKPEEKAPTPKPEKKEAPNPESVYQATLRELHEINEAIPGEEMSAKISQLEHISARIFALAEQDPKKRPLLNRFMDYYLPTAKKLLKTYATLDRQGIDGENITEAKSSIENSMDLLVKAFETQLDKLFEADALDVSGDIAALQGMINMDGLLDSDFKTAPATDKKDSPQA